MSTMKCLNLLKQIFYNSKTLVKIASVNYDRNVRDWPEEIDAFNWKLDISEFVENVEYNDEFNGNVSDVKLKYRQETVDEKLVNLGYIYDGTNRLISVEDDNEIYSEAFSYDNAGRIKQKRKGSSTLKDFDKNIYDYYGGTSRLKSVSDIHTDEMNYVYDDRGKHGRRQIQINEY